MVTPELEILFSLIEKGHFEAAREILPIVRTELESWKEVTGPIEGGADSADNLATE